MTLEMAILFMEEPFSTGLESSSVNSIVSAVTYFSLHILGTHVRSLKNWISTFELVGNKNLKVIIQRVKISISAKTPARRFFSRRDFSVRETEQGGGGGDVFFVLAEREDVFFKKLTYPLWKAFLKMMNFC